MKEAIGNNIITTNRIITVVIFNHKSVQIIIAAVIEVAGEIEVGEEIITIKIAAIIMNNHGIISEIKGIIKMIIITIIVKIEMVIPIIMISKIVIQVIGTETIITIKEIEIMVSMKIEI